MEASDHENESDRKNSTWSIEDGRLVFRKQDGTLIAPSAEQVWKSIYSDSNEFPVNPAIALPEYSFSRFPLDLALLLTGKSPGNICVKLVANLLPDIAVIPDLGVDQLIVGNTWYPIDLSEYEDCLANIGRQGIELGHTISVGQLIWLKKQPDLPLELIDHLESFDPSELRAPATLNAAEWGLNGELYPYQRDGVHFINLIAGQGLGCIIGDEMGLGKTIQVIAVMLAERTAGHYPSLIVAPATLLENWRRELAQFAPSLSICVHAGSTRAGIVSRLKTYDVVITSYDIAVRDEPMLSSVDWNLIALDEAQNIKNPEAQRTTAIKRLPRRVSLAVTGTPVENRLTDLWSLSDFALPGLLGSRSEFESAFANTVDDASRLAPIVAPILLRRRVKDVAKDLPERIDVPQNIQMSRRMAEMYEDIRIAAIGEYKKGASLAVLTKLRMFCCHPSLADCEVVRGEEEPPKYQRTLELLDEIFACSEKCLIFTSYTRMIDMFIRDLPSRFSGMYFNFIDGRVPVPLRQGIVDEFSACRGGGALVLNPRAAGVGLNITAANHVVHYNPEWNPAIEDQASARAYRRKQQRPVTVHQLYYVDTVEEFVVGRLALKRGLAEHAATGHEGEVTPTEIMQALSASPLSRFGGGP